jgi:MSHA biogenesis protein MshP
VKKAACCKSVHPELVEGFCKKTGVLRQAQHERRVHLAAGAKHPAHRAVRGFSLVAALFLIVVVAALGAFAVRIGMGQQQTVNLALLSARALSAANSGIEYGAYQALNASTCVSATLSLSEAGLAGFTVDVTCTQSTHTESSTTPNNLSVYRIEALASYGTYGTPDFVSRRVFATFASTP